MGQGVKTGLSLIKTIGFISVFTLICCGIGYADGDAGFVGADVGNFENVDIVGPLDTGIGQTGTPEDDSNLDILRGYVFTGYSGGDTNVPVPGVLDVTPAFDPNDPAQVDALGDYLEGPGPADAVKAVPSILRPWGTENVNPPDVTPVFDPNDPAQVDALGDYLEGPADLKTNTPNINIK